MKLGDKLKKNLATASLVLAGSFSVVFGTSILANVHNAYLRILGYQIVKIVNSEGSGGTGFLARGASGGKFFITNAHVCRLAEAGQLRVIYQGNTYIQSVNKPYKYHDLCAVRAPDGSGIAVNIASSVVEGESVYVIGHPLLEPLSVKPGELSGPLTIQLLTGIIGMNMVEADCAPPTMRLQQFETFFGPLTACVQTLVAQSSTVDGLPGNSGSPVVNIYGSVVGVLFAGNETGTRSYIVPLEDLKQFLREL